MKKLVYIGLLALGYTSVQAVATKYICSQNILSDTVYTSVFPTAEECNKYCKGIGSICEETEATTEIEESD